MSGYGITSPFPTIDTVLPARNRRVGGDSRVTWFTGSARGAAERCWSGAARDPEPEEEERRDRSPPNRRHGKAPEALPRTVRTVDADRLERSCRRGPDSMRFGRLARTASRAQSFAFPPRIGAQ